MRTRKPKTVSESTSPEEVLTTTSSESEETPTPRRRRRTAEEILQTVESSAPVPVEEPAKPKRAPRAKKAAVVSEDQPSLVEAAEEAAPAKPKRASRAKPESKPAPKPTTVQSDEVFTQDPDTGEELFTLSWRSKPADSAPAREEKSPRGEQESEPEPAGFRTRKFKEDRRERGKKSAPAIATVGTPDPDFSLEDEFGLVTILEWRAAGSAPMPVSEGEESEDESVDGESGRAPRRSRTRKRRDRRDTEITAAAAIPEGATFRARTDEEEDSAPEPEAPKAPAPIVREPISRREDAPQVILQNGQPVLVHNKTILSPIIFHADYSDHSRRSLVMEEVRAASDNGITLFSVLTTLRVNQEEVGTTLYQVENAVSEIASAAPDAKIILRLSIKPEDGWMKKFPVASYRDQKNQQADPSVCDDEYWGEADASLAQLIEKLRASKLSDRILGIHLDQGEWFQDESEGYDTSEAAKLKFRLWLRHRYRNDNVTLRAAWFDGGVTFDTVEIPLISEGLESDAFVRTDRKSRRWIDYHLFVSDSIVDRIADLCYTIRKASSGDYLTGVSYGYTFEWSHPYSGHLSLGKLLRCPDLDYIAGPPSYSDREPGGSAAFPFPVDSFALNGKMFMSEEDFKTPISGRAEIADGIPVMKTPQALESAHWRGAGGALAHNGGVIWMDTYGAGWLNSPGIWERAKHIHDALLRRLAVPQQSPDVALFIDERSLTYLTDPRAFEVLVQQVRESILRSGLSVGFYLLSDLAHRENFPESRLYVFVNAWDVRPEVRSAIKSRLQRDGKTLFWLYSAGLFEAGRESLERVREVTGIALRPQPYNCKSGTTLLNSRDDLGRHLNAEDLARGGQLEPSYFAIPEEARVLGEYTATGLPSFVVRDFPGDKPDERWRSVFLGEPVTSPGFFRALGQFAGAHVWSFENDLVHVTPPFLTVHCSGTGQRTIMLPSNWVAYDIEARDYMPVENSAVKFKAVDGSTHTFVIGPMGEVSTIVKADLTTLTTITEPIHREENTLRWDSVHFDVQIMKLDEWVEETWSEELADDLLLKPSMVDLDGPLVEEGSEESGDDSSSRRRRRRRRRGGGRDSDDNGAPKEAFGDTGVSVLFRKRE